MTSREDVDARVAEMPDFAFFSDQGEISHGPSQVFTNGEDHEVNLALRTGRALQAMYGERLDVGDQIAPADLQAAMDSVAYVPVTKFALSAVIQILGIYWLYWERLP